MRLLDDAHRLGILRQVGATYQFRHAALQDHLAKVYEAHNKAITARLVTLVHIDIFVMGNEVRKFGLAWSKSRYLGPLVGAYAGVIGSEQEGAAFIIFADGTRHELPFRKVSFKRMHIIDTEVAQFNTMVNAFSSRHSTLSEAPSVHSEARPY